MKSSPSPEKKKDNPFLNISLNVIIPSIIMTKFSGHDHLGPFWGLITALIFPVAYGCFDLVARRKFNIFSLIGLISVLLTGGIGLLKLSKNWMIAKETLVPLLFALATFVSGFTRYPFIKVFLGEILRLGDIDRAFRDKGHGGLFEKKLRISSHMLTMTFLISAILNFFLAITILEGEPGTVQFNQSLGKMTALSFPVITIPMLIMTGILLIYLCRSIKEFTHASIETFLITTK